MLIQPEVQLTHCTTLLYPYIHIHPGSGKEESGKDKRYPLCLKEPFRKSNTTFQLVTQRPELSHMATLGTEETVKYMVVLNPGSDSKEEGIMNNEIHSLPHFSRHVRFSEFQINHGDG